MTVLPKSAAMLSDRQRSRLTQIEQEFAVSKGQLQMIVERIHAELPESDNDNVQPLPRPVDTTVLGMSIEASGQRIRITSVKFSTNSSEAMTKVFVTPPTVIADIKSDAFLEYVAFCLREFINSHSLQGEQALGISIVDEGSGPLDVCCGEAVKCRLRATFLRAHLPVRLTSVTTSAVSLLAAARHSNKTASIAVSLSHGIGAAYHELDADIRRFDIPALPQTMWDRCVDRESRCPGAYPLEKLVGARYLGEIVRNLITDLMDERLLFAQTADPSVINTPYAFHSLYIAPIVEDKEMARRILDTEFGVALSDADCIVVKALCKIVAKRSALIVAALVAALVMRAGGMPVVALSGVLVDGNQSLVDEAVAAMQSLVNRDVQVLFQPRGAEVLGAAVMAAS